MKTCNSLTTMGHGEGARCGQQFYGELYQCGACAKAELKSLQAVLAAAQAIAAGVDRYENELGRPVNETYKHPGNGKTEENALTVNMRLLNNLRKALKELK